jgi:pentatricopeptide repeat protein
MKPSCRLEGTIRRRVQSGSLGPEDALRLFDKLLQRQRQRSFPGSVYYAFNNLITAVARCRSDEHGPARAVSLFSRMARGGAAVPDAYTYGFLVSCCCRLGRVDLALSPLTAVFKASLTLEPIAFTPLLRGLCNERGVEEAVNVVRLVMLDLGCAPNVVTYCIILKGLCDHGRSLQALEVLRTMVREGDETNVVSYTTVICNLFKEGKVEDAVKLFDDMRDQGVKPNVVAYGSVIDKLCKVGAVDKANGVLRQMVYEGVTPDCAVYNSLIHGYSTSGHWEKAVMMFEEMIRQGIKPNVAAYSSFMTALCKQRKCNETRKVFYDMVKSGKKPDATAFSFIAMQPMDLLMTCIIYLRQW